MQFKYRKEFSKTLGVIYRPVAEVIFINADKEVRDFPYVDSGADITLIPRSVGELLGFELGNEEIKEMGGVGGSKVPTILKTLKVRIGEFEFPIKIAWALVEDVPPLLGRVDVFDKFEVTFRQKEKITEFKFEE
jgi:hypothetical protein